MPRPSQPRPREAIQDFGRRLPEAITETPFTVFVCGPTHESNNPRPSAVLRQFVSNEIANRIQGVTVVWGEHKDFRGIVGEVRLRKFNDLTKEIAFAISNADLVLIFPDSPGSFVELGSFGIHERICPHLVIVFDRRHKKGRGFVVKALGRAARNRRAIIRFLNYRNRHAVLREVERIIRAKQENRYTSISYAS